VLSLLPDAAEEHPLVCLVDEQWLDRPQPRHISGRSKDAQGRRLVSHGQLEGQAGLSVGSTARVA
jgi:hypothetical protein